VLVSIQRGDEVIIPRGDTHLHAGDVVTTLCERESIPPIKHLLIDRDDQLENEPMPREHEKD
jgi:Trk K+ transport system NAD-binding subunit